MSSFLEVLAGILLQPRETIGRVARSRNLALALALYSLVLFFSFAATVVANEQRLGQLFVGMPFFLLLMLIFLFFSAAVFQLAAEFLGGQGKGVELFIGLAMANTPYIFSAPAALLGKVDHPLASAVYGLFNLFLFGWVLVLNLLTLKELEGLSTVRAAAVLLMPFFLLLGSLFLLLFFTLVLAAVFGSQNWADLQQLFQNFNYQ